MLNFCAHFLSRRTKFTAFTDVIVTIVTNLAEQDLFLCKVPKIAFGLQQCCKFGTKSKASGSCTWPLSLIVALLLDHHPYWWFTPVLLADFSEADQRAVKYKLLCWQINGNYGEERGGRKQQCAAKVAGSPPGQLVPGRKSVNAPTKEWNPAVILMSLIQLKHCMIKDASVF